MPPDSSTSHQTGSMPARIAASVVAKAVSGVVKTRAPRSTPAARRQISIASRPLATPTAWGMPHHWANSSSKPLNFLTEHQPAAAADPVDRLDRLVAHVLPLPPEIVCAHV